jgi:hypothetical protein
MSGVVSMWNCRPHAVSPTRNAWFAYRLEDASSVAPAGSVVISSQCHCSTSGVNGTGPNSGSPALMSRLATSAGPNSGPSSAGLT